MQINLKTEEEVLEDYREFVRNLQIKAKKYQARYYKTVTKEKRAKKKLELKENS